MCVMHFNVRIVSFVWVFPVVYINITSCTLYEHCVVFVHAFPISYSTIALLSLRITEEGAYSRVFKGRAVWIKCFIFYFPYFTVALFCLNWEPPFEAKIVI